MKIAVGIIDFVVGVFISVMATIGIIVVITIGRTLADGKSVIHRPGDMPRPGYYQFENKIYEFSENGWAELGPVEK